jgi:CRP-like cAMP-binding protein
VKSSPQGQEQELAVIGMGDFLGEMALIDKGPRSASALIKRNTTLLVLSKRQLDILMERDHEIALKIYRIFATTLSERLRTANARVTELANKVRAAGVYEPGIHIRPPK